MKTCVFNIVGMAPGVLMNNPTEIGGKPKGVGRKTKPTAEEDAATKVYTLPSGQLCLPTDHFRQSLINGGKGLRLGKEYATSLIKGTVFAVTDTCPLATEGKPITSYAIDTRRAVIQKQGIPRSRPLIEKWETTVEFEYDPDFITAEQIGEVMDIAGRRVGVGDYRPQKGGPFGRFTAELISS